MAFELSPKAAGPVREHQAGQIPRDHFCPGSDVPWKGERGGLSSPRSSEPSPHPHFHCLEEPTSDASE